jgi:ABC-type lipoprotein export system ATPase subunit
MAIVLERVEKILGTPPVQVLTSISLTIEDGDFVALTGRSGSGKSSLLYLMSSLDSPTQGTVMIDGKNLAQLSPSELGCFRNEKIGFVFQFHYLIAELTALENVLLPTRRTGQTGLRLKYAKQLLERVGLGKKLDRLPRQLSGGEQQRVAIARAFVMEPAYLFADEPTGALDSVNGEAVMQIFEDVNREKKTSIVLVTHEADFAKRAKKQIHLADGKIIEART